MIAKELFMLIKSIEIVSQTTESVIRKVQFHRGTNFVVDAEDSESHNKVGKTTFLKLINILLGSKDRAALYHDDEINAITPELQDLIQSEKIYVEGVFGTELDGEDPGEFTLRVDLFLRGKSYVDGKVVSKPNYVKKLNELFFDSKSDKPTFRQLIGLFVRVVSSGDDSTFLKFLTRASNAEHRASYEFIFGIADREITLDYKEKRAELERILKSKSDFKKLRGKKSLEVERQVLENLITRQQSIKTRLSDLTDAEVFLANREEALSSREKYEELLSERADLSYELRGIYEQHSQLEVESLRNVDLELYDRFYREVSSLVPSVQRTYEEMIDFNVALIRNRLNSLDSLKESFELKIQDIDREINILSEGSSANFSIVADEQLVEYEELLTNLSQTEQLIGASNEAIEALLEFDKRIQELKTYLSEAGEAFNSESKSETTKASLIKFNSYFSEYAKRINGEDPILVSESDVDKFPISIEQLGGTSTGTRKSLISAFDLAMQRFLQDTGRAYPEFVVHDVIESVEGEHLKNIFEIANSVGCQYIVAVLSEKLHSSGLSQGEINDATVLVLGHDDLPFEPK